MMMLGRHSRLILDSWTRPKYTRLGGAETTGARTADRAPIPPYGEYAGLAFWLYVTRDWVDGRARLNLGPILRGPPTRPGDGLLSSDTTMTVPLCPRGAVRPTSSSGPGTPGDPRARARRAGA